VGGARARYPATPGNARDHTLAIEHLFDQTGRREPSVGGRTAATQHRRAHPGARDAFGREDALQLLAELGEVQGRLDDLKGRLRELAEG
jgi:hypothetical protein